MGWVAAQLSHLKVDLGMYSMYKGDSGRERELAKEGICIRRGFGVDHLGGPGERCS